MHHPGGLKLKYIFTLITKDMELNRLVPQQGPLSQEAASWTEWGVQETQVALLMHLHNEKYNRDVGALQHVKPVK